MKKIFYGCLLLLGLSAFSQTSPDPIVSDLSPNGVLDNIFDQYGNAYKLSDLITGKEIRDSNGSLLRATNPTPMTCGYFNLYFEDGCGFTSSDPNYLNRRAVICQVFTDLSNFINSPLTNPGNNTKINIWVRNINNILTGSGASNGVLGLASSFYSMPYNTTAGFGGVVDNEIWKTIHTGVDSYTNVVSPLVSTGISSGSSGIFYHGMVAFNFTDTTTPINWNTSLTATSFPNLYDLYTVALHELTHALGFASLINANGASKFAAGYNYYSRYDRFLKNNGNTQFLLTNTGACSTMYNYGFNSELTSAVLHPTYTSPNYCSNAIKYISLTTNVPVYTPSTFEPPSSLSHFEDALFPTCASPYGSNLYFTMSKAIGTNVRKRFLKPEERRVLGDLGYSVKTTYGVSTTYQGTTTYTGTITGIPVAGTNDGINADGTFKYSGNGTLANPIIINSSTDVNRRLLLNDTSVTGFECLQDVFDTTARFNGNQTSVTSLTNPNLDVTFNTTVSGLHLLRYVPVNGGLRGNITYVYVYVHPLNNCATPPTSCNLVRNGNFEQYSFLPADISQIAAACGWTKVNTASPDYFHVNAPSNLVKIPCNGYGHQAVNVSGGQGYAGMIISRNITANSRFYEPIKTELVTPLSPNSTYLLSLDVSLAETSNSAIKFQAYLSDADLTVANTGSIPISNANMLYTNQIFSTVSNGWQRVVIQITTGAVSGEKYLYLGGFTTSTSDVQFQPFTSSPGVGGCSYGVSAPSSTFFMSYYYVDNVELVPLNGGSFILPTTLCHNTQSLLDLRNYLNGLPTNGVFSGPGVNYNGVVYTLNEMFDMDYGLATISYTYTNATGCSVTIYSNINVELPIIPTISGSSTAYTTSPNNATVNSTTIPSGYTALWTITGGSGTITTANNQSSVGITWTALPGNLTLTLTSPGGCAYTVTKTIFNQFSCDCLNTFYFTYVQTAAKTAKFTVLNSNPNCTGIARYKWNYGDTAVIYLALSGSSHVYTTAGTYTVTLYPSIVGDFDETICSGNPYSAQVTVTSGGRTGRENNLEGDLIIYPSPASSVLNFNFSLNKSGLVETIIRTVDGKELLRKQWNLKKGKHEIQLDLPDNISDGMVFAEIVSDEIKEIKTILVKKN